MGDHVHMGLSIPYIRNQEEEDERYEQMKFGIYTRRLGCLMLLWRLRRSANEPPALPGVT